MKLQARQVRQDLQAGKRVALIDVRTPLEHEEMHIAGAHLMPLDRLNPAAVKAAAAGHEVCVLVCRSGQRAEQAYAKLHAAGCEKLAILEGGMTDWEAAGLPLERGIRKHLPLIRQV